MDRVIGVLGNSEILSIKPEILVCYGAFAIIVTVFVNWALATLVVMLKPFTCAAIMLAFVRPDLAQVLMQDEYLKMFSDKFKVIFCESVKFLLSLGQQFRSKIN